MPVTVIVGGQYGSEGKGKVAHYLAQEMGAAVAIRIGGPNSGHTVIAPNGEAIIFRHLPTSALLPDVHCIIGPGSYLDVDVLLGEINLAKLPSDRISVDPHAFIIEENDRQTEEKSGLRYIGSTLSGTGAALQRRICRDGTGTLAKHSNRLSAYVRPTIPRLRDLLDRGERVVLEGTQGFGLSLLHGPDYPKTTSRDTTAAAFLSESGLSPLDVDDIVLVLRAFPIRVPGDSGPLPSEIDWETIRIESGSPSTPIEYTSVTCRIRRIARFHPDIVRQAIQVNQPTRIVLNHLDYVDASARDRTLVTDRVIQFARAVESEISRRIDYYGLSPSILVHEKTIQASKQKRLVRTAP